MEIEEAESALRDRQELFMLVEGAKDGSVCDGGGDRQAHHLNEAG